LSSFIQRRRAVADNLWYTGPSGRDIPNPTADQMLAFMRQGYDHWGPYSPVGVLVWHEHPPQDVPTLVGLGTATQRQQLLFVRHPRRGWYFEYSTSNLPRRRWLVPLDPAADRGRYVRHWAYGERLHFLAGCFVPQPAAERVVLDFLATREPSPAVAWVPFESVAPRLDSSGYRERRRSGGQAAPGAAADGGA
jgi:hypothetical protein